MRQSDMSQFKSSAELKASAREHLLGHYGTTIGAFMITGALTGIITLAVSLIVDLSTVPGTIIYYAIMFLVSVLTGLFSSGSAYLYLKLICGRPVSVGDLFYGFQLCPDKAIIIQAWITLLTYISSLPQIILNYMMLANVNHLNKVMNLMLPYALSLIFSGVVSVMLGLFYAQTYFLLHDFPQYTAKELLQKKPAPHGTPQGPTLLSVCKFSSAYASRLPVIWTRPAVGGPLYGSHRGGVFSGPD